MSTPATRRKRRRWAILAGLLLLIVLALVGAYLLGDASSGEESEGEGEAAVACSGDAVTPNLPSDFPQVEGMTYTKSETSGPSEVADGPVDGQDEPPGDRARNTGDEQHPPDFADRVYLSAGS